MSADTAGPGVLPEWLRPLARAAADVRAEHLPEPLRPPDGRGRAAAVLILFCEGPEGPDILLTERSADMRSHAGQPAFPGGAVEPDDASPAATALREAAEETGLDPQGVEVFLQLPDVWLRRTGYRVSPVLAWWREPAEVHAADSDEVAAVARVPVRDLADVAHRLRVRHPGGGSGPAFRVGGMLVWGFTAVLLDWVLRLGGWERPWDSGAVEELPL